MWWRPGLRSALRTGAVLLALVAAHGQTGVPASATGAGTQPVVVKMLTFDIEVGKDLLATETVHVRLLANNAAAAQEIGQQPVPFDGSLSDAEIIDAYTLKADGQKIPVDLSSVIAQQVPGSAELPMFDSQREKIVVFPQLEAGDFTDLTYKIVEKAPTFPGMFSRVNSFSPLIPYDDVEITIVVPKDQVLHVETHDMQFERRDEGETVSYLWHYAAPNPVIEDNSVLSLVDRSPRMLASTAKDYDTFAHAYAALVAPKTQVTPKIQAEADEITQGLSGRREEAQKIYEWVSRHIRYVALEFGQGALVPHDAEQVLTSGYGDCKDHVALFSALLKAKGIEGDFVLVNATNSYVLPDTAVIGQLDHAITWLPEFHLYADTTAGVAPFGTLPFPEYGKPVVRVTPSGPALAQIPTPEPGTAVSETTTKARIDAQGVLTADTTMRTQGAYTTVLRALGLAIQGAGGDRAAAAALKGDSLTGTGNFVVAAPDALDAGYTLSGSYALAPDPDLLSGRRFAVPGAFALLGAPGDGLAGPLFDKKLGDDDPTPCYAGTQIEDVSLDAPDGRVFDTPPNDTSVETQHIKFTTHWSVSGAHLSLHREFTSTMDQPLCTGALRKEAAKALADIRASYDYGIAILPQGAEAGTSGEPSFAGSSAGMSALRDAIAAFKRGDFSDAIRRYSDLLAQTGLAPTVTSAAYAGRGTAYIMSGNTGRGIADLDSAAKLYPDVAKAYPSMAETLAQIRLFDAADQLWSRAIAGEPKTASYYDERGVVRDALLRHAEAQADFTQALALAGTDPATAGYYVNRGASHWAAHEWRDAIADFSEAIRRNAALAEAYDGRGRSEVYAGDLDAAHVDLEKSFATGQNRLYSALWLYVADARAGKDAKAELARRTSAMDLSAWPGPVVSVMRGDTTEDQIRMPTHPESWGTARDDCEKDFYLGEMSLATGNRGRAAELFRAVIATNITEYIEYFAAQYELALLGA